MQKEDLKKYYYDVFKTDKNLSLSSVISIEDILILSNPSIFSSSNNKSLKS